MKTRTMSLAIVVVVTACFMGISLGGRADGQAAEETPRQVPVRAAEQAARPVPMQEVDKYKDVTVFMESFLVQCDLEALYAAGVSPIGAGGGSVTVDHVLQCFKGGKAHVITGAKLAVRHNNQSKVEWRVKEWGDRDVHTGTRTQSGVTTPIYETRLEQYPANLQFEARVIVATDSAIRTNFTFHHSGLEASGEGSPFASYERRWSDSLVLTPGTPTIVGATQNRKNIVLLILTAHITQQ